MVAAVNGDRVRTGALAHAVQLHQWHVQAHEVLQSLLGDGGGACEADLTAVQTQSSTHLLEGQIVGEHETPWHHILAVTKNMRLKSHLDVA